MKMNHNTHRYKAQKSTYIYTKGFNLTLGAIRTLPYST